MSSCLVRGFDGCYNASRFGDVFVVAFAGLRGSGKSTVADALSKELSDVGIDVARFSFASQIKEVVNVLVGTSTWDKEDVLYSSSDWDVRQFLMRFGTEFVRDGLGEDFWVDGVAHQILERNPSIAIIDDMRFSNEYAFVRALGVGVLIERTGTESHAGIHRSEMPDALGVSDIVSNDADISDAVVSVRSLLSQHSRCPF